MISQINLGIAYSCVPILTSAAFDVPLCYAIYRGSEWYVIILLRSNKDRLHRLYGARNDSQASYVD